MENLFVIVGLSNAGKSTLLKNFCENRYSFEYFGNDQVSRNIRYLFNVSHFSNANAGKWKKVEQLGNTGLARYWLYTMLIMNIEGDVVFSEGYRYYFEEERRALEAAVSSVCGNCKIHYLHLKPPLQAMNRFRMQKGTGPITSGRLKEQFLQHELKFCDFEFQSEDDLAEYVSSVIGEIGKKTIQKQPLKIQFADLPDFGKKERDIDEVSIKLRKSPKNSLTKRVGRLITAALNGSK